MMMLLRHAFHVVKSIKSNAAFLEHLPFKMWLISMYKFLITSLLMLNLRSITAVRLDSRFCGFEQKCTSNTTYVKQKMSSCCRPCECADVCREKDTCCSDKTGLDDTEVVTSQQCIPAAYMPERDPPGFEVLYYYARNRCPREFRDLSIKDKCERAKPESLEDIMVVSSEDGTVVYKNKFCGLCYGDENTKPWAISLPKDITDKCQELTIMQNVTATSAEEYLLDYCTMNFERPNNVDIRTVLCFKESQVIGECNKTGMWEVYDTRLENLCHHTSSSLFYLHKYKRQVFANLYCYLCNMKATVVQKYCPDWSLKFTNKSLLSIINYDVWTGPGDQKRTEKRCNDGQILDTFFDVCRKLYCPMFSLSSNGRCVPFIDLGIFYQLVVRLLPLDSIDVTDSAKNELGSEYLDIQRQFGFGGCKTCFVFMYLKKDTMNEVHLSGVYVIFAFGETKRCKLEQIWSKLTSIERSVLRIQTIVNKKVIRFDVHWENKTYFSFIEDQYERFFRVGSVSACRAIPPKRLAYCPKVRLTQEEHDAVLENHPNAKGLLFGSNKEGKNGSVFVCCDRYILEQSATDTGKHVSALMIMSASLFAASTTTF